MVNFKNTLPKEMPVSKINHIKDTLHSKMCFFMFMAPKMLLKPYKVKSNSCRYTSPFIVAFGENRDVGAILSFMFIFHFFNVSFFLVYQHLYKNNMVIGASIPT